MQQLRWMPVLALEALAVLLALPSPAGAEVFLSQPTVPGALRGGPQDSPTMVLHVELERVLGGEALRAATARSERLEAALRTTFASLPKGEHGTVGASAARYALHRLFVQMHGWQLQGLDPSGGNWSTASPTAAFGSRVPEGVKAVFDGHLSARGFSLHELALLAAMLEYMVHGQIETQLHSIFGALQHPTDEPLSEGSAIRVIDAYMASYILGANSSAMTLEMLQQFNSTIQEQHPSWPETKRFLREMQREVRPGVAAFNFTDIVAVVETAADRFGQWQSGECLALKEELVALEDAKGSGRVRLADFYGGAVHGGKWQFSETVEYLRHLGAIDDADSSGPRVIIPNYIYSPANCLASSSFYAVCCIDECEELLDHLESSIGQPTATPEEIVRLVSALPSASGNTTLPPGLVRRLEEVAEHHGGHVPLHGRLLGQWLHHARPRECPYPHVSGTTAPRRSEEWEVAAGQGTTATEEEMAQHIQAAPERRPPQSQGTDGEGLCSPMWTMEEELVDAQAQRRHEAAAGGLLTAARAVLAKHMAVRTSALLAAAVSLALALAKMLRPACAACGFHFMKADKLPRYTM
uniref:Uncharacterized protein n=1 Tax=Alexandrium catenella TaxID=2925 RepID=A0A7S1RRV1_ALECA|mmetsp:Transcript_70695/g.187907  ORF Transcript_70695/g.187907 Transcript_70695/m.187907 type:complete len:583 (+) Transcript_70695:133-1881(+)